MLWKTLIKQYFVSGKSDCINMRSIVGARLSRKYFYFLILDCMLFPEKLMQNTIKILLLRFSIQEKCGNHVGKSSNLNVIRKYVLL
jgi:hypothetical protein